MFHPGRPSGRRSTRPTISTSPGTGTGDLAIELDAPLGNVSYHVRTLADLGLVKLVKRRTRRGAVEHYYQARGRAQVSNRAWAQVPGVVKRSMVAVALEQAVDQAGAAAAGAGLPARIPSVTDSVGSTVLGMRHSDQRL